MIDYKTLIENVGKLHGHFKTKENRVAKLIEIWPDLESKLIGMIERGGGETEAARLAYAVLLMMETGIRTGNEGSAEGWICINQIVCRKANKEKKLKVGDIIWRHPEYGNHVKTYGLTTLLNEHVKKSRGKIKIEFVGKKLVDQSLETKHPTLVKYCPENVNCTISLPFLDITYSELKKFVKKYVGNKYTPKDLRTAKVNMIFAEKFSGKPFNKDFWNATTKSARKKILGTAIEETAEVIGHTKGVCKSAYLSKPMISFILETGDNK